jgi:ribose-phosphate pyrophosphokinase
MQITRFPDGQINVVLDPQDTSQLNIRINSYEDLFIMKSWVEAQRNGNPTKKLDCYIPCLFGQRSDRRFNWDESFGLKLITDFINSCSFNSVKLFHPHSDVGPALINNSYVYGELLTVTAMAIRNYSIYHSNLSIVSPDAGAYKWVFKVAENHKLPLVASNKFRDNQGKINLNFSGDVSGKDCLILDDMAEFGNTFINLAKQLKDNGAKSVGLYISHFLGGGNDNYKQTILRLRESIDAIYTTNSVRDFDEDDLKLINVHQVF